MNNSSTVPFQKEQLVARPLLVHQRAAGENSFFEFMLKVLANRRYLVIALAGSIVQFTLFKCLYPFPDFFSDSYSYIFAAYANLDVSIWPIGYSKFLRAFHFISQSDTALIAFQYFLLELAALYFFFTTIFFFRLSKSSSRLLFIFLFFDPLFLYLSNYVNSDPLFAALSILWITQLFWVVARPKWSFIIAQAILLFLCFAVRNNAYYYPLITILAFMLSKQRLWIKIFGSILPFAIIVPFIFYTRSAAYRMTGTHQYSLFTGWQLANNALYFRDQVNPDSLEFPTQQSRELDRVAGKYFKIVRPEIYRDYLENYVGNFFIRQPEAPLKQYLSAHYTITNDYNQVVAWGKASAIFADYGSFLIRTHPLAFLQYYVWPNTKNYFLPPLEKLEVYNLGADQVFPIAQKWFGWKSLKVRSWSKDFQGVLLFLFPPLFLLLNLYLMWSMFRFISRSGSRRLGDSQIAAYWLITGFLCSNFCFTVLATINVFRYQFVPMIVCMAFSLLLMEWLDATVKKPGLDTGIKTEPSIALQPKTL